MRRLLRRLPWPLFTILAAASLVGSATAGGLWLRQRYESDRCQVRAVGSPPTAGRPGRSYEVQLQSGTDGFRLAACRFDWRLSSHLAAYWYEQDYYQSWLYRQWWQAGREVPSVRHDVDVPRQTRGTLDYPSSAAWAPRLPPLLVRWVNVELDTGTMSDQWGRGWAGTVRVPSGLAVAAFAVLPVAWDVAYHVRRRRRRRARHGLCVGCGYDLRASADRCPECGRAVPARGA